MPDIDIINAFTPVTLDDIANVKLMNRVDRKYWFHKSLLKPLLETLASWYNVLEVENQRVISYQTIYFDFPDNELYLKHHNGFRERYKFRRRKYSTARTGYFEIKRKNNKERTFKSRIEVPFHEKGLTKEEFLFLKEKSTYGKTIPEPVLSNSFNRISLVDKEMTERCTIDFNLKTWNSKAEAFLENLVVIEVKRGSQLKSSLLISELKKLKVRQKGLSKYCTGRSLLDPELKHNAFKPRLIALENKIQKINEKCLIC